MTQTPYLDRQLHTQRNRLVAARDRLREQPDNRTAAATVRDVAEDIQNMEALDDENRELGDALLALLD